MEKKKMDFQVVKYMLTATVLILVIRYFDILLGGVGNLWSIASPLVLGAVIAYVLNIIMKKLEKIYFPKSEKLFVVKSRRPVCILLSMVLIVAVLAFVICLVVPELVKTFVVIGQAVPVVFENVVNWLTKNAAAYPEVV